MLSNSSNEMASLKLSKPPSGLQLTTALPGWTEHYHPHPHLLTIGILCGEGIGPEVMSATVEVLQTIQRVTRYQIEIRYRDLLKSQPEQPEKKALTPELIKWVETIFNDGGAFLCGPAGNRFVYDLRAQFDFFCKLTPIRPSASLSDTGVIRQPSREKIDLIVVRENVSGEYFGEWSRKINEAGHEEVRHTFAYSNADVRRIIEVGVKLAQSRRGQLTLVVKPDGIPGISKLWTDIFHDCVHCTPLRTNILEVDNACYQIIAGAQNLDVLVAPNLFGDILADNAALLLGSRGLSYSGNFAVEGKATYQTGHGAAHDIAGKGIANPIGQIMSMAFMLRESFGLWEVAAAVEQAVEYTLAQGIRTPDLAAPDSTVVGTEEMGHHIAKAVEAVLASS